MAKTPKEDLKERIAAGKVVLVVGTGVSLAATDRNPLAGWPGLLKDGIERCSAYTTKAWATEQRRRVRAGTPDDLIAVACAIEEALAKPRGGAFRAWFQQTVGQLEVQSWELLRSIANLNCILLTTNYDGLLERATGLEAITWQEPEKIVEVLRRQRRGVVHLHGYWDEPASVVFGSGYDRIRASEAAQALQTTFPIVWDLLFVGCGDDGLADPNIGRLLTWLGRNLGSATAHHIHLCRDSELRSLRKKPLPIPVSPIAYGKDHKHLLPFLRELAPPAPRAKLPPCPPRFGRDDLLERAVAALLDRSRQPLLLLGGPGLGKSHLSLVALHDERVARAFGARRYFVSAQGALSAAGLVSKLAEVLGVEGSPLEERVFGRIAESACAVAVDNAETPWEQDRAGVGALLARLADLVPVSVVASFRGGEWPTQLAWRETIRLEPLEAQPITELFLSAAGTHFRDDPDLNRLLGAIDGVPLAAELFGAQAQGEPSLASLWRRWDEHRTRMLTRDRGKTSEDNLDLRLGFAVAGSRVTPEALRLLSLLALLPDGAAEIDLEALLPTEGPAAARTLALVGLAFWREGRLRCLAPVREYVARAHLPAPADRDRLLDNYFSLAFDEAKKVGSVGGREAIDRLRPEEANLESLIIEFLDVWPERATKAAIRLARPQRFTGIGTTKPLERAAQAARSAKDRLRLAQVLQSLGDIMFRRSDHAGARSAYEEALRLSEQIEDMLGRAKCIWSLGNISREQSDSALAHSRFEEALELFRTIGDLGGQAASVKGLGDIALDRSDHAQARTRFEVALKLFCEDGDVAGQANCILSLGDIARERSDHMGASVRFEQAFRLFHQVGDLLGQANCVLSLGDIALDRSDKALAKARYHEALPLYRKVGDILGQANCIASLGDTALESADYVGARSCYQEALRLYQQVGSIVGQANCIRSLGDIARSDGEIEAARSGYLEALELYGRLPEPYSMGWARVRLARICSDETERREHVEAARKLWMSIDRLDLVAQLDAEFPP